MLYPQNGDRILTVDSVTSLHPMYRLTVTVTDSQVIVIDRASGHRERKCADTTGTVLVP